MITSRLHGLWLDILNRKIIVLVETVVLLNNKFAKAKDFVQIGIDAEDYYRIKDAKSNE